MLDKKIDHFYLQLLIGLFLSYYHGNAPTIINVVAMVPVKWILCSQTSQNVDVKWDTVMQRMGSVSVS